MHLRYTLYYISLALVLLSTFFILSFSFFSTHSLSLTLSHAQLYIYISSRKEIIMIYLPSLTALLVFLSAGGGGVLAAPSETAPIQAPLEFALPPIPSDQYIGTDYIDKVKTPVQGIGSKTVSCSITPLIDHKSLVCC